VTSVQEQDLLQGKGDAALIHHDLKPRNKKRPSTRAKSGKKTASKARNSDAAEDVPLKYQSAVQRFRLEAGEGLKKLSEACLLLRKKLLH
jgi:hypothetical protein